MLNISALEKHACNRDYIPKMGECAKSFVEILAVIGVVAICATPLIMFDPAFMLLPSIGLVCMISLLVVTFASQQYDDLSHKKDCNHNIIKGLQEQLKAEQNLEQQSAAPTTEEQKAPEDEPDRSAQPPPSSDMSVKPPEAAASDSTKKNSTNLRADRSKVR